MPLATIWSIVLFFIGFYILVKGSKTLIKGASFVGRSMNLSPWTIGVLIVGIGTSLPEFSINVAAAFSGSHIGLSAIAGSSIFNTLFVLGVSSMIFPIVVKRQWVEREIPLKILFIGAAIVLVVLPLGGAPEITRLEALIPFTVFVGWIIYLLRSGKTPDAEDVDTEAKAITLTTAIFLIVAGIVGVFVGGKWVVGSGAVVAGLLGMPEELIGFTLVAIGTSLPELSTTVVAALERRTALALGGIVGAGVFNFSGTIGMVGLLHPISVDPAIYPSLFIAVLAAAVLWGTVLPERVREISRKNGFFFILLYLAYLVFLFTTL